MASVLQNFVVQKAVESGQIEMTDDGPVVKFSDDDILEWIKTGFIGLFEGQNKFEWRTAPDDPDPLKNDSRHRRIAVFGDWGTAAYGRRQSRTASATILLDSTWCFTLATRITPGKPASYKNSS